MREWEKEFDSVALAKGKELAFDRKMMDFAKEKEKLSATFAGVKLYHTEIVMEGEKPLRMHCGCPKARGGNCCEHMAALLYRAFGGSGEKENETAEAPAMPAAAGKADSAAGPAGPGRKRGRPGRTVSEQRAEEHPAQEDKENYQYFDMDEIRKSVTLEKGDYIAGRELIGDGNLELEKFFAGYMENKKELVANSICTGHVRGRRFRTEVIFEQDSVLHIECGCADCSRRGFYWYSYDLKNHRSCPYVAGALLLAEDYLKQNPSGDATDRTGASLLHMLSAQRANRVVARTEVREQSLRLEPRLRRQDESLSLSFRILCPKSFVVKDLSEFIRLIDNSETAVYGNSTEVNHQPENFDGRAREWIDYIRRVVQEERRLAERLEESLRYARRNAKCSALEMYGWRLDQFFELLGRDTVEYEEAGDKRKRRLTGKDEKPEISLQIVPEEKGRKRQFQGVHVACRMPVFFYGVSCLYFVKEDSLCRADREEFAELEPLYNLSWDGKLDFSVGRNKLAEFYYSTLPQLGDSVTVMEENPERIREYLPPEVSFRFYLDARDGDVSCRVHACYESGEISILDLIAREDRPAQNGRRMLDKEQEVLYQTMHLLPVYDGKNDELCCDGDEERIYQVIEHGVQELAELGEVQCTRQFQSLNVIRQTSVSVGVSVESDLLRLEIDTHDISREELLDVLASYRLRRKYYRLKNGSFLKLEDQNLQTLEEMTEMLQIAPRELLAGKISLPVYRTLYLNRILEENESIYNTRDSRFREMVKEFKTVQDADFEIPKGLENVLRSYQANGYKWLRTLAHCSFGGILADEMGLGKTLQMIAFFLSRKQEGMQGTSLVVAPASLVYNWCEELGRFAPQLSVMAVTGSQQEREKKLEEWQEFDVLVTSYDLLKRDIESYEGKVFLTQVIDEAQYIKNHNTTAAKAVKAVQARQRFALTGTPVENRLSELWSIFDYLMPGFLYRYETFRRQLETPIVKNGDQETMERLRRMTGPFLLRRRKADVLRELPDKLEESRYVRLEGEQRRLYDAQAAKLLQELEGQTSEEFQKNRMQLLAGLTRLRQLCCDPALCFENYRGGSAKLDACLELIVSAIDGGHRLLVFSQFTSMLEILGEKLSEAGISYDTITGATPKERRLQLVKDFNANGVPVFLISLKAGGVGLNLTGADVVIHYDPWWNLAVQNQATDRAHRIGQTKKVTVYKMIASHSVEEKIQKLQESKRDLAEQILNAGEGQLAQMSREELLEILEA
ncbi:MAG: DEAD/DEAH box helicase [Eubacteriales bacterium]|nr:DEAD/DEAH box helicase [Eubacteriales bacterium]